MIKKILIIGVAILLVILCLLFLVHMKLDKTVKLPFSVEKISTTNYNNYLTENTIDYNEGNFCYIEKSIFGSNLKIIDENSCVKTIKGISSPFQLYKDEVFFLDDNDLCSKKISNSKVSIIAKNIYDFSVLDDGVVFLSEDDKLYFYDTITKKDHLLKMNINQFVVDGKSVFATDNDDYITKISLDDFSHKKITKLPVQAYPFEVMTQGNNILFTVNNNKFGKLNIDNDEIDYFNISEDGYINNTIHFVCDEYNLYYCLQCTKTDGSIVNDIDSEENGVYKINLETYEKEKISSETFDKIYLFENNMLIGERMSKYNERFCVLTN